MTNARRLLSRLREMLARGAGGPAALRDLAGVVASELVAEVCSIYLVRPGEILELAATAGLNPGAVGRTRLRVGEGIVGTVAAQGGPLNLPDAQNHPAFAYRPETGEDPFASLLGLPIRRGGATVGVLTVQNRAPRLYAPDEVELLETVAMLLATVLPDSAGADGLNASLARRFPGQILVPGLVVGAVVLHGQRAAAPRLLADDTAAEAARLDGAIEGMRRTIDEMIALQAPASGEPREILDAYRLIAGDSGWLGRVRAGVASGFTAEAAVERVLNDIRGRARRIADPVLRERIADIEDAAGRLLDALYGGADTVTLPADAVLVARRLGPAELLDLHARGICGVVLEEGSAAGHAAIVARALGVPVLGGVRGVVAAAQPGDPIVLDAEDARVVLRPESNVRGIYLSALAARRAARRPGHDGAGRPSATADGVALRLMINAGLASDLAQLDAVGADGVGLFRTEIAALAVGRLPDAADQRSFYARVLDAAGTRPVLFRTFDLGGDKLLPGDLREADENPAMGWRAIRVALDRPSTLRRQLRALIAAADGRELRVMFPMLATVAEFRAARALLAAEAARAGAAGTVQAGAMLEVPALYLQRAALFADAAFVSVGTNDLLQFLFAADRGSAWATQRYDLLSAPVLDLLADLAVESRRTGTPLSVCGEHAGRPLEAMVLVALGITTLSMAAPALPRVRDVLARVDAGRLAAALAAMRSAGGDGTSLREPLQAWARDHGLPV